MNLRFVLLAALLLVVTHAYSESQPLAGHGGNLEGMWRFHTDPDLKGDQEGWAQPGYDDSTWRTLRAPGLWEPQGIMETRAGATPNQYDYDGVAWYRLRFTVPGAWANKTLELRLGIIDDEDQTYLNGKLIGETQQGAQKRRSYAVPNELIQSGKENVLVIRVKDGGGPGGIAGPILTLLPKEDFQDMKPLPQSNRSLEDRFKTPPADARILKIVHGLPDDAVLQDEAFAQLMLQGFGGVVTNISFDQYLESEDKWAAFVRGVNEAKQRGMSLWLYDEHGYPSGNAGGLTMRNHPEWEARGRYVVDTVTTGGAVTLDLPPGKLIRGVAYPIVNDSMSIDQPIDLSANVKEGKLQWDAPAGKTWRVMVITENRLYEGTHAEASLCDKLPYVNLLQPEPTARFIELTHDAYAKHLGNDLSKWFVATFTDEPSLMSLFFKEQPWRVIPWAPNLPEAFIKSHGYDIEPLLPALFADAGPKGKSIRYDYWQTVGQLVADNFFGQLQTWGRAHNIPSGGHLLLEESFLMHVPLYGDFFRCIRKLDAPSIDCLSSLPGEVPWYVARLLGSAADLEGHPVTMCEISDHVQRYRPAGDTRPQVYVKESDIRGSLNRLMVGGINTFTSYYSFEGLSTEQLNRLNEWSGRVCTTLRGGCQATDIALLYPAESAWTRFTPARRWINDAPADARRIERVYRDASENLFRSGRDFTFVDSRALSESVSEADTLKNGALRWRVVVLPAADTMPLAAWERLAEFWRHGGTVVALTVRPANSEQAFPDDRVLKLADEIFGTSATPGTNVNEAGGAGIFLPVGSESMLSRILDSLIEKDLTVSQKSSSLRYTHRTIEGKQVYFVINDSPKEFNGDIHMAATGKAEQWDPVTGEHEALAQTDKISLKLGPYGGMIYQFDAADKPRRLPLKSGGLPDLTFSALPEVQPIVGAAESVQTTMVAADKIAFSGSTFPAWTFTGTQTKKTADTFLFASFEYASPIDLSKAQCVAISGNIPEKQTAATSLLVVLRDTHGNDYFAENVRGLNDPGAFCIYLGLNQFNRAGWTKDTGQPFDWTSIVKASIGWGGYPGVEGRQISFTASALQIGKEEL